MNPYGQLTNDKFRDDRDNRLHKIVMLEQLLRLKFNIDKKTIRHILMPAELLGVKSYLDKLEIYVDKKLKLEEVLND